MHKIKNMWKFELNRSSNLRDNNERQKHPCHTKLCEFRWLISRPQVLNLRSRNQIHGKLLLSQKLWLFRGSRFSQCFIPSTSPHYSSPRKVLCYIIILSNYQQCLLLLTWGLASYKSTCILTFVVDSLLPTVLMACWQDRIGTIY